MAGLPKKYAKMGFKKGWKAYKSSKKHLAKRESLPKSHIPKQKGKVEI